MNAVNLMPAASSRRRSAPSLSVSREFMILVGGLFVVLIATVLFVSAHDRVSSRQAQLAKLTEGTSQWTAAAAGFQQARSQLAEREKAVGEVKQLVATRYDWSQLLSQIAGVMPAGTELSSLNASSPSTVSAASAAAAAAGGTGAAALTSGIQLSACATSQAVVADTMVALRRVTGIAQVTLSTSTTNGAGNGGSTSSGGASSSSGCALPVSFQLDLAFGSGATDAAANNVSTTGVTQ